MSTTKQTTIWCDHPMEGGVDRQADGVLRCVKFIQVDTGDAYAARVDARAYGWSVRRGIGDCCADHSASLPDTKGTT